MRKIIKSMKPNLSNATIFRPRIEEWKPNSSLSAEQNKIMIKLNNQIKDFIKKSPEGYGNRIDYIDGSYEFNIGSKFKILSRDDKGFYKFNTTGTSSILSLYNMVQGFYKIGEYNTAKTQKSEDYDILADSKILILPRDYVSAAKIVEEKYIGKTLRVIAKSPKGSTKYGGCFYIFTIDD